MQECRKKEVEVPSKPVPLEIRPGYIFACLDKVFGREFSCNQGMDEFCNFHPLSEMYQTLHGHFVLEKG
jgi:hypothetical protein